MDSSESDRTTILRTTIVEHFINWGTADAGAGMYQNIGDQHIQISTSNDWNYSQGICKPLIVHIIKIQKLFI